MKEETSRRGKSARASAREETREAEIRKSREGHFARLRNKFRRAGFDGLVDYEAVELLLTLGSPRADCKLPAKEALKRFGDLAGVLDASDEQLKEIHGLGPKNIIGLRLVKEAARAYLAVRARKLPTADSPAAVRDYLRLSLVGLKKEKFVVLLLNNANRVMECVDLFSGTVDQAAVFPREVVELALNGNASRVIFAHNHPAGTLRPSRDDIALTGRLKEACEAVGVDVLDHIVVGGDGYYSFRESGLL